MIGGWDETLFAAQDKDFFTCVALSGADIRYQPGCCYIYRQYGAITVSSSNLGRWVESHRRCLEKSELALAGSGRLTEQYKNDLAVGYFGIARGTTDYDSRGTNIFRFTVKYSTAWKARLWIYVPISVLRTRRASLRYSKDYSGSGLQCIFFGLAYSSAV